MSKGDTFENDLLNLIFKGDAIANIADNAGTGPLTDLYVALHTTPGPGEAGTQDLNEVTYTGPYARVAVARGAGWTVSGNAVVPAAEISFPAATGAGGTATHWSVGVAASGATKVLYYGTITPNIVIDNGVTPKLTVASEITED